MNENIKIVVEVLPPGPQSIDSTTKYSLATIQDLKLLKKRCPGTKIRHADITPHVRQNCDAAVRVLSSNTVEDLKTYVPSSNATQLYLQASLWVHEPFRNDNFGSPTAVAQGLWAGIMTWRCWRRYIELNPAATVTDNFISRSHYLTLELMAHAGILHQSALYMCFPNLSLKEYSMRNTGNCGIEAIHSILHGASPNLPITSANLTF